MPTHVLRTLSAYPREAFGVFVLAVAALFAALGLAIAPSAPLSGPAQASTPMPRALAALGAPPAPEPLQFREVTPEDARTMNAVIPFSALPNPPARAIKAKFDGVEDEARALDCLTAAVYYEAAVEGPDGQRAVAQVVLNRLRHPAYPSTVCGVVFQGSERSTGCQFTFTCDGSLARAPVPALWERARAIAWAALSGQVFAPVGWSTHYHTDWVVPYWASSLAKAAKVGTHIFYRWTGGWGQPAAFRGRYAGVEPSVGKLAAISGAHAPLVDVAAASGDALDKLAEGDPIVITARNGEQVAMRLPVAAATAAAAAAGAPVPAPAAAPKPDAKVPWELRWALTGVGPQAPEPALGTAPVAAASVKPCPAGSRETSVPVPGSGDKGAIKVRERCGA